MNRPRILEGEIFAAVELDPADPTSSLVTLYRCSRSNADAPPDDPKKLVIAARKLIPYPSGEHGLYVIDGENEKNIVILDAVAFLGIRSAGDDGVYAVSDEERLACNAVAFGKLSTSPSVRKTPLGVLVSPEQREPIADAAANRSEYSATDPSAANNSNFALPSATAAVPIDRKPLKTGSHTAIQVQALVKKDLRVFRNQGKCGCCAQTCFPFLMIILAGINLLTSLALQLRSTGLPGEYMERTTLDVNSGAYQYVNETTGVGQWSTHWPASADCFFERETSSFAATNPCQNIHHDLSSYASSKSSPNFPNVSIEVDPRTPPNGAKTYYTINWNDHPEHRASNANAASLPTSLYTMMTMSTNDLTARTANFFAASDEWSPIPNMRTNVGAISAIYLLIGLLPALAQTTTTVVEEKRVGFREHLHVMGCGTLEYLTGAFLSALIRTTPIILIITIMARIIWWKGLDVFLIWLVLTMYVVAKVAFGLFLPSVVRSTVWAQVVLQLVVTVPVVTAPLISGTPAWSQILISIFLPSLSAWYGLAYALSSDTIDFAVSYGGAIGILIGQSIFYTLASQYLHRVFPGEFGAAAHPLYFLQTSKAKFAARTTHADPTNHIVLKGLKKYFGTREEAPAVNLSLDIKRGEILSLLGHNGAGKTTTMSMLTGIVEPTEYEEATFDGLDMGSNMDTIRLNVGICPQHDILLGPLSARDHLQLFANLRDHDVTENRLDELLMFLELPLDHTPVQEFSGGMKRRVSVACALVADPAVIFLDEPTTALDEVSRHKLWDLLKMERKKGTTMVLTTHMMEEAEHLGDRIAIMNYGELHSCGSSMQLRAEHGNCFFLALAKNGDVSTGGDPNMAHFDQELVDDLVCGNIPDAVITVNTGAECIYALPIHTQHQFPDLFLQIEDQQAKLGVKSYGINMTTLEDVFVSIQENDMNKDNKADSIDALGEETKRLHAMPCTQMFDEIAFSPMKILDDVVTILVKRTMSLRHQWLEFLLQVILPILLVIAAFAAAYCPPDNSSGSLTNDDSGATLDNKIFYAPILNSQGKSTAPFDVSAFQTHFLALLAFNFPLVGEFRAPIVTDKNEFWLSTFVKDESFSYIDGGIGTKTKFAVLIDEFLPTKDVLLAPNVSAPSSSASLDEAMAAAQTVEAYSKDTSVMPHDAARYMLPFVNGVKVFRFLYGDDVDATIRAKLAVSASFAVQMTKNKTLAIQDCPYVAVVRNLTSSEGTSSSSDAAKENKPRCSKYLWATSLILVFAVSFQAFPVMVTIHDELSRGVYDTMLAHGLTSPGYWIGNFIFDQIFTLLFPIGAVIGMYVKDVHDFTDHPGQMAGLFFATFFYCMTMLAFTYTILVFNRTSKLSTFMTLNLGIMMILFALPSIILLPMEAAKVKLEHPGYPMLESLSPVYSFFQVVNYKRDFDEVTKGNGGVNLAMLVIYPIFPFALIALKLSRGYFKNRYQPPEEGVPLEGFVDADVLREMHRLDDQCREHGRPTSALAANHTWIKYRDGKVAVKGVTFGVENGECFGLLGANGAGKTSTMRMLQLELDPSGGNVTFGKVDSSYSGSVNSVRQMIRQGICQQHDTLHGSLTAFQNMELHLKLRLGGAYRRADWIEYINCVLGLSRLPTNKIISQFSGGMKRKLAVSLSIFTGGEVCYLDEPSTGLDPFARRLLWKMVTSSLAMNRAVLLTTHSMEEADALCNRISIVVDGNMKCIGSSQHLKNRFGSGYVVTLMLSDGTDGTPTSATPEVIDAGIKNLFGDHCKPTNIAGVMRQYNIGNITTQRPLSETYRALGNCAEEWKLKRFAISQSNLQQVFLAFAQNIHSSN